MPLHSLDITTPLKDAFTEELPLSSLRINTSYNLPVHQEQMLIRSGNKISENLYGSWQCHLFLPGGFHGMTHGALSLTGNLGCEKQAQGLMPGVPPCLIHTNTVAHLVLAVKLV